MIFCWFLLTLHLILHLQDVLHSHLKTKCVLTFKLFKSFFFCICKWGTKIKSPFEKTVFGRINFHLYYYIKSTCVIYASISHNPLCCHDNLAFWPSTTSLNLMMAPMRASVGMRTLLLYPISCNWWGVRVPFRPDEATQCQMPEHRHIGFLSQFPSSQCPHGSRIKILSIITWHLLSLNWKSQAEVINALLR